ncbi:MAG: hypothetical protein H6851_09425 [Geminicoccaceae bacterium]|nr:hypothetical protein [Geminicoccaceae bacterium]
MRTDALIELVGDDVEIAGIGQWLEQDGQNFTCSTIAGSTPAASRGQLVVGLFVITGTTSPHALSERLRRSRRPGEATAACIAAHDRGAMAMALALGFDDVLTFHPDRFPVRMRAAAMADSACDDMHAGHGLQDDARLRRQLRHLTMLARARHEVMMRDRAELMLRPADPPPRTAGIVGKGSAPVRVLLIGRPSQVKVLAAEALAQTSVSHAERVDVASQMLRHEPMDIIIVSASDEASLQDLENWQASDRRSAPLPLALVDERLLDGERLFQWMRDHRISEVFTNSMTIEEMRLRLHFWQQVAIVRRKMLRAGTSPQDAGKDEHVRGTVSRDTFQAYLELCRKPAQQDPIPVFALRCDDLWDIAQEHGYEIAGELLERMVASLLDSLSLFDIATYCGNGQLIVMPGAREDRVSPLRMATDVAERVLARLRADMEEFSATRPHFSIQPMLLSSDEDIAAQLHRLLGQTRTAASLPDMAAPQQQQRIENQMEPDLEAV